MHRHSAPALTACVRPYSTEYATRKCRQTGTEARYNASSSFNQRPQIDALPRDVLGLVLEYADSPEGGAAIAGVCHQWRQVYGELVFGPATQRRDEELVQLKDRLFVNMSWPDFHTELVRAGVCRDDYGVDAEKYERC